jgi:hypothetical protein
MGGQNKSEKREKDEKMDMDSHGRMPLWTEWLLRPSAARR